MLTPSLNYVGTNERAKFNGDCLKQEKKPFNHGKVVKIRSVDISSYPTIKNFLFGAVKLTKHFDIDQYKYFGCGIRFNRQEFFQLVIKFVET